VRLSDLEEDNLRIVKKMLENGILGRWDVVRPFVADDFVCYLPEGLPYGRTYHGWQGYKDVLGEVLKFWTDVKFGPNQFAAADDTVIILSHIHGRIAKTRREVSMPLAETWVLEAGKVISITAFYFDTKLISDLAAH
jgi:ketosteroid isomerase-like protein